MFVPVFFGPPSKKDPWTRRIGLLQPLQSAMSPFEKIGIDTLGPFRRSQSGNEKIIVITGYMSKWAIAKAVPRENAGEIAQLLIDEVILKFGAPEVIISDRGKSFNTELMKNLYREFNSKHIASTPYHPQTNGLTERFNKTLAIMLSMYVSNNHRDWDQYLKYVVFAYNTVEQDSTGYAPFYLLFGCQSRMVTDVVDMNENIEGTERLERLHEARELAIRANRAAQGSQKRYYDRKRFIQQFNEGDLVLIHRARGYTGQTTKLRHPYEGPFRIIARNSDLVYLVENLNKKLRRPQQELVHVSRMKPYRVRDSSWDDEIEREGGKPPKFLETDDTSVDKCRQQTTAVDRQLVDRRRQPTTKMVKGKRDNTNPKQISWIRVALNQIVMALMIIHCVTARIVWRKTPLRVNQGFQDVTFLAHYLLPCQNGTSIYKHRLSQRQLNVTARFETWCETYTRDVIQSNLNLFCSDGGTTSLSNPQRMVMMRSMVHRPDFMENITDLTNTEERKLINLTAAKRRRRRKPTSSTTEVPIRHTRQTALTRYRRFVWIAVVIVVAVVTLAGGYGIYQMVRPDSRTSNIDDVVQRNLENSKKLAEEVEEVNKRVDDAFRQLNLTIATIEELKDQLDSLQLEANVVNQATVASLVSRHQILAHDLREIANEWHKGRLHPKFVEVFKYREKCLDGACPIELHTPVSCVYNAIKQDIYFKLKRRLVRDDVEIVNADPFTYYKIPQLEGADENKTREFWKNDPYYLTLCESKYQGKTHLAITNKGCLKHVSPTTPRETDIPIVTDDCLPTRDFTIDNAYSQWGCQDTNVVNVLDREAVQLKNENQQLLVYCPYQYYQITGENKIACPLDKVVSLPIHTNVSIWRHPLRSPNTPIVQYTYGTLAITSDTQFDLPSDVKLIAPNILGGPKKTGTNIFTHISRLRSNILTP